MPGIYSDQHCDLSELLKRASHDEGGATLLIPDLQRPYVWTPTQVRLLVDSLIRGWPFGTFLTWRVKDSDPVRALARPFWQLVDRTGDDDGNQNMPMQPPSSFQMVLDGQQRIQSLLLAVGGDAWGFKLFDREWAASLSGEKLKSGANHWSIGTLCVDLDKLVEAYATGKGATSLDYTQILQWVITGPDSQSGTKKKKGYNEPLAKALGDEGSHKFIRLSRLWNASVGADVDLRQAEQDAADFLTEKQGLPAEKVEQSKGAVASLLTVLGRVKAIRVTYLELAEFKGNLPQREEYNDAVVNIFTRLNTAGRTLTREDITFAWLKTNWIPEKTNGQSPTQCFESLVESLEAEKLTLNIEQLVGGVSFVWASLRDGNLLTNSDLLKGDTIRPMASDLSENWDGLTASFVRATQIIRDHGYRFHEHYDSLNSIFVVWAWQRIADQWAANHKLKEIPKDSYEKATAGILRDYLDRWILCSQWAGRWAVASAERISGFSKRLFECSQSVKSASSPTAAAAALRAFFDAEVKDLEADATNAVQSLSTPKRELVRIYYTHLFIWHRLNEPRWKMSQIALRTSNRRKTHMNVDHSVAYALWERKLIKAGHVKDTPEMNQILVGVNELGNCALLERDFNISKSDGTLEGFLSQVHEFATEDVSLPDWAAAMALPQTMLDPDAASLDDVSKAITERTKLIRDDLSEFIAGKKTRVDL